MPVSTELENLFRYIVDFLPSHAISGGHTRIDEYMEAEGQTPEAKLARAQAAQEAAQAQLDAARATLAEAETAASAAGIGQPVPQEPTA